MRTLNEDEKWVREQLGLLYPQLVINCKKVLGTAYDMYGGDLLAVSIEYFLNKPVEVQVQSFKDKKAENFITFMMNLQAKSVHTKFYQDYKRHTINMREYYPDNYLYDAHIIEDNSDDDLMLCIKGALKKLNPYERMLVEERIINGMGYDEIRDKYDIPYSSLSNDLQKVKRKISKICQHLK